MQQAKVSICLESEKFIFRRRKLSSLREHWSIKDNGIWDQERSPEMDKEGFGSSFAEKKMFESRFYEPA